MNAGRNKSILYLFSNLKIVGLDHIKIALSLGSAEWLGLSVYRTPTGACVDKC